MTKALYGYFGNIIEHNAPYPGHPLYQLNFLDSLSKAFLVNKFDMLFYNSDVSDFDNIYVHKKLRSNLYTSLIEGLFLPYNREMPKMDFSKYDVIFLKHRFENSSRLKDMRGLDVEVYDWAIKEALKYDKPLFLIDSDAEIMSDDKFWKNKPLEKLNVLTFFNTPQNLPCKYYKISPTSRILLDEICELPKKVENSAFSFDGNNYLKDPLLFKYLTEVYNRAYFNRMYILGKNWPSYWPNVFDRSDRISFYTNRLESSVASLNITKPIYQENGFASPRVVESFMLGEYIYSPSAYTFMPEYLKFDDFIEFYHKMIYGVQTYSKETLLNYAAEYLSNLKEAGYLGV